ncbi:MAG TPA: hypothetical protein VGF32_07520, partial [Streptosporangiaceae bacterium]
MMTQNAQETTPGASRVPQISRSAQLLAFAGANSALLAAMLLGGTVALAAIVALVVVAATVFFVATRPQ